MFTVRSGSVPLLVFLGFLTADPPDRPSDQPPRSGNRYPWQRPDAEVPEVQPDPRNKPSPTVEKGVAYLKRAQLPSGTWALGTHQVGLAALPALALLECGVP